MKRSSSFQLSPRLSFISIRLVNLCFNINEIFQFFKIGNFGFYIVLHISLFQLNIYNIYSDFTWSWNLNSSF